TAEQIFLYTEMAVSAILFVIASFPDQVPNLNELLSSPSLYGHNPDEFLMADEIDEDMPKDKKKKKICPKETASFPSKLSFWWFNSLAFLGFRRPLTVDDLWQIRRVDRATSLFLRFNQFWKHKSFTCNDADIGTQTKQTRHLTGAPERLNSKTESYDQPSKKNTFSLNDYNQISAHGNHVDGNAASTGEPLPKINVMSLLAKQSWRYFIFPSSARFITATL